MTTLPEEAVKAADRAIADIIGKHSNVSTEALARAAINAGAPFLAPHKMNCADLEEAIRLAEIGEYLYTRSYSYGDGYSEPREYGIEWQWQQTKPNEFGQGALLGEAVRWHKEQADDGVITEASKLRRALSILSALEPSAARKELMKQIREGTAYGFLNDGSQPEGNPDLDCPYCCGSGHKGDVQPSAARELALEEAAQVIDAEAEEYEKEARDLRGSDRDRRFCSAVAVRLRGSANEIRALSSPDHADAGKVEGGRCKWSMREIVAKAIAYHSVGDPHAKTIRGDQRWKWFLEEADKFISVFGYYLPPIPSAPASEGAE